MVSPVQHVVMKMAFLLALCTCEECEANAEWSDKVPLTRLLQKMCMFFYFIFNFQ